MQGELVALWQRAGFTTLTHDSEAALFLASRVIVFSQRPARSPRSSMTARGRALAAIPTSPPCAARYSAISGLIRCGEGLLIRRECAACWRVG
jgi:ABC-type nitrate/sulfonate/bicarbonate transport system ATPase subunit